MKAIGLLMILLAGAAAAQSQPEDPYAPVAALLPQQHGERAGVRRMKFMYAAQTGGTVVTTPEAIEAKVIQIVAEQMSVDKGEIKRHDDGSV